MVIDPELIDTKIEVATRDMLGLPFEAYPELLKPIIATQ